MKPIWTGAIGFGLVNIPVKMYSATAESNLDFDMLDKKDLSNIRFQRVNEKTGKEVAWENIVKGYKLNNKYVIITDKDFAAASAKKSKVIEISDFLLEKEIDTIYYDTPYYLEPDKNGLRAYALLRDGLIKTGKVGVGTYVLRNKETLAILKPYEDIIVLNKIRFSQEVRDYSELNIPGKSKVDSKELKMAISLIDQLSGKFDLKKYKDEYTGELLKVIKAKSKGAKIVTPKLTVAHRNTDDLMSQLKASLSSRKKKVS
ncbi:MAG: Ku protein [Chitinophagales bacterium]